MKNTVFAHTATIAVLLLASGSAFAQTQPAPAAATAEGKAPPAAERQADRNTRAQSCPRRDW